MRMTFRVNVRCDAIYCTDVEVDAGEGTPEELDKAREEACRTAESMAATADQRDFVLTVREVDIEYPQSPPEPIQQNP